MIAALESSKKRKNAAPAATTPSPAAKTKKPRPSPVPASRSLDTFFSKKQKTNETVPAEDSQPVAAALPSQTSIVEDSQPVAAALPSQTSVVEDSQPMNAQSQQVVEDSQAIIVIEDSIAAGPAPMEVDEGDSNTRLSTMSSSSRPMRTSRQQTDEKMNAWLKGQTVQKQAAPEEAKPIKKKEFTEQDLLALKELIRANSTKTQKQLVEEFKSNASSKMVAARISTVAKRAKWTATDLEETWRLVEDLTETELASSVKKPKRAPVVELTEEEQKTVDSAKDLLDTCKSLLREIFSFSPANAKADTTGVMVECDFDQATKPSPEVIQIISSVVTASRMLSKEDIAAQVLRKLKSSEQQQQHVGKVVEWIDLVAKRVEYDEDLWAFEMENARGKRNVWLKSLNTTKRDINKFIVSKLPTANAFTKLEERVNKVKREWFVHNTNSTSTPPRTTIKQQPAAAAAAAGSAVKINPLMRFFAAAAPVKEKEEGDVIIVDDAAAPTSAEPVVSKRSHQRIAFLFVDSRVQVLHFDRSTQQEYFGVNNCVTGRAPFKLNPNVDYDIDSEDEDGESLAENEQEEADDLDYTDRWLAADDDDGMPVATHMGDSSMRVVGVCLDDPSAFPNNTSNNKPMVSIRNQPFESRNEFPELVLTQYSVIVHRKRGLAVQEDEGVETSSSPAKKPALRVVSQDLLPVFCQVVEGSALKKDELVNELVQRFGADAPSKLQITKKLAECAAKLGKRWVVKSAVLLEANVERNKDNADEFQLWAKKKKITEGTVEEKAAKAEQELFTKPPPSTPKKATTKEEAIIAPPPSSEEIAVV